MNDNAPQPDAALRSHDLPTQEIRLDPPPTPAGATTGDATAGSTAGSTAWRSAWRTLLLLVLALVAATAAADFGSRKSHLLHERLIAIGGTLAFAVLSLTAVFAIAGHIRDLAQAHVGSAHAVVLRLVTVLSGGFTCLLITLGLLSVPISQLILGGALTGVVFGIAGQQTLANLFAGIVLLLARPFTVGQEVRLRSGALGGFVDGVVLEIGLAYLRLQSTEGTLSIPNSQVLNAIAGPRPADGG
ncbi:mechanosensitive ion channel family protein [Planosporangium thailandense]|uniref:Mechanosensitive ion channel family protein n=1 Tax=Planosporangium thailandense TaxID=765197 RepID=A0ABX0Y4Z5_9ACTN|nr:mechanosensitive ion channel family protein [Planosporangium thailandense]NJC73476.1 mechanosensitive ion channel family protein [Planosporangium thailandense]